MQTVVNKLSKNKHNFLGLCNSKYTLQVYADAKQGNIKKCNGTVLCRFYVDADSIYFAFAKDETPYEFGYKQFGIPLGEKVDLIKSIPHKCAEELYNVITYFRNNY